MRSTELLPRFACPDWWEKIQAGQTPMPAVPVNPERAAKALAFFNRLKLTDVAGNPPLLTHCGDWFRDIMVAFLASEEPDTKQRLVWELLCMVPKKNSKTTYVAALGLTASAGAQTQATKHYGKAVELTQDEDVAGGVGARGALQALHLELVPGERPGLGSADSRQGPELDGHHEL